MKKPLLISILISLTVMLVLPGLSLMLAKGDAGWAVLFILFYAVNPLSSIIIGLLCAGHATKLWPLPLANGLLFWLGMWMLSGSSDSAFAIYGALYALVGMIALGLFYLYKKNGSAS